jgi:hypothetical protein
MTDWLFADNIDYFFEQFRFVVQSLRGFQDRFDWLPKLDFPSSWSGQGVRVHVFDSSKLPNHKCRLIRKSGYSSESEPEPLSSIPVDTLDMTRREENGNSIVRHC